MIRIRAEGREQQIFRHRQRRRQVAQAMVGRIVRLIRVVHRDLVEVVQVMVRVVEDPAVANSSGKDET